MTPPASTFQGKNALTCFAYSRTFFLFFGTQISRLSRALTFYFSALPNLVYLLLSKYQNIMVTVNPHLSFMQVLSE